MLNDINYFKLKDALESETIFDNWRPFKNEEIFLFHLKRCFRSQDIYTCVLTFLVMDKNGLISKVMLILKFMISQPSE